MRTKHVEASLVNRGRGDPVLFIDLLGRARALLFDLGEIFRLDRSRISRVSDIFVSHTHMDHFFGFNTFLRASWGHERVVRLWGPPGLARNAWGALSAFTWNLAPESKEALRFVVREVHEDHIAATELTSRDGFQPGATSAEPLDGDVLLREKDFTVTHARLDHRIPCLAFAFTHADHLNVDRDRLRESGLPEGPWLRVLKELLAGGDGRGETVEVLGEARDAGELADELVVRVPGERVAYVTDTIYSAETERRVARLARGADIFFCECAYLHEDQNRAAENHHLTARQAGMLAAAAEVRDLRVFHFSPLYAGRERELVREAKDAWRRPGKERSPRRAAGKKT